YPWWRIAQFLNAVHHLPGHTAQVRTPEVGGHGYHPLHVVAFVLADGGALGKVGDVAKQNRLAVAIGHRDVPSFFNRVHVVLWDLHLNLVSHTTIRIGPIVRDHKAARRCGGDEGPRDFRHLHPHEPGALAIHHDVHRWIIQCLSELHVTKRW